MAVFAVLSLRATGIGFIMITLALGEILWGLAYRWISLTNGDNGINLRGRPQPFGFSIDSPAAFYYTTLVVFLLSLAAVTVFVRSPLGAALDGHARSAAPHERARLPRLGDPLLGLHVLRAAHRDVRHPVRLLHAIHQSAGAGR